MCGRICTPVGAPRRALSCVDGFFYAGVNLSDFDVCRLPSCVRPFDAVDITAGLDEVRTLGPNQTSELVSPDSASGCPNFSSFGAVRRMRTRIGLLAQL